MHRAGVGTPEADAPIHTPSMYAPSDGRSASDNGDADAGEAGPDGNAKMVVDAAWALHNAGERVGHVLFGHAAPAWLRGFRCQQTRSTLRKIGRDGAKHSPMIISLETNEFKFIKLENCFRILRKLFRTFQKKLKIFGIHYNEKHNLRTFRVFHTFGNVSRLNATDF